MEYIIENPTEYEISNNIRDLLDAYIDSDNKFIEFVIYRKSSCSSYWMPFDTLYIHKEVINTPDYLFSEDISNVLVVYNLSVKYIEDYTRLIRSNKIDEFFNEPFVRFKGIKSKLYGNDKYIYNYHYAIYQR